MRQLLDNDGYVTPGLMIEKLHRLKSEGRKIHIIFDADHVLVSGRSHDVFDWLLNRDVSTYREYEARQFLQLMEKGPWTELARTVGQTHTSQDIVTARAGYAALRVLFFCLAHRMTFRDMIFLGSQSKSATYAEILKQYKDDRDWHVFMLDDSERHVRDFAQVARKMKMTRRCYPLLTRRERPYAKKELQRHFDDVMRDSPHDAPFIAGDGIPGSMNVFLVIPEAHAALHRMLQGEASGIKDVLLHQLIRPIPV